MGNTIMDAKQIAFIICTNNAQYYDECVRYIQDLYVPENYVTDIICIQEADSMAQGYNAGMKSSNARYKVYLHQDTFILNRNFLYDILDIFKQDENIGMIGVLGARELPENANCYLAWDAGAVIAYSGEKVYEFALYQDREGDCIPVKAIDGLIMITQVDLLWREDLLSGWDFYDISQSLEMDRSGYKVVIPYQKKPWCYHDCGVSEIGKYHAYRHKMIEEYPQYFIEDGSEDIEAEYQRQERKSCIRSKMINLINAGAYDQLMDIVTLGRNSLPEDTYIREIVNLMDIYNLEKANAGGDLSEWWHYGEWEQIYENYQWIRFVLIRMGYQREDERIGIIRELIRERRITVNAVRYISMATLGDTEIIDSCFGPAEDTGRNPIA